MANQNIQVKTVKGLIPALNSKEVNAPYVIEGRNFALDAEGPYSAFPAVFSTYDFIYRPELVETVTLDDDIYYCTNGAILRYDSAAMSFYPVFVFTPVNSKYPWTTAYVGTQYYLCRKDIGVIQYDPRQQSWTLVSHAFLPVGACAVTNSYGRLVILGSSKVAWSALDDGTDLTPSLTTGAGFQGTSMIGGVPMMVKQTIDGFITFTVNGIMKSEYTDTTGVFRHYVLTTTEHLLNPFAIATTSDLTHIFLDRRGMFQTEGKDPQPYDKLFSEFLNRKLFPKYDLSVQTLFRLYYSEARQFLCLSVATPDNPTIYTKAYVLYMNRGEWGSFDEVHYSFGTFNLTQGPYAGYNFGYVDTKGYVRHFEQGLAYKEGSFDAYNENVYWQSPLQYPAYTDAGVFIATDNFRVSEVNPAEFEGVPSGLYSRLYTELPIEPAIDPLVGTRYTPNLNWLPCEDYIALVADTIEDWNDSLSPEVAEDWLVSGNCNFPDEMQGQSGLFKLTLAVSNATLAPLNAYIKVGLFRLSTGQYPDELTLVTDSAVGMFSNGGPADVVDFMTLVDETVDYLTDISGDEDYGYGIGSGITYGYTLVGSNDGVTEFQSEIPTISHDIDSVEYYTNFNSAIYHWVQFSATQVNQAFHLRFLELSGNIAGRL